MNCKVTGAVLLILGLSALGFFIFYMDEGTTAKQPVASSTPAPETEQEAPAEEGSSAVEQALSQIQTKLAAINEYSLVYNETMVTEQGTITTVAEHGFRRPDHYYLKRTATDHFFADSVGLQHNLFSDGKDFWFLTQAAPGSGQLAVKRIQANSPQPLSPQQIQSILQMAETPSVIYRDLEKMAKAGLANEEDAAEPAIFLNPFDLFNGDKDTLRLESEDEQSWSFSWKLESNDEATPDLARSIHLVFQKADCILSKAEIRDSEGKVIMTRVFSEVKINPGLKDELFTFTPPEGAEVIDRTGQPSNMLIGVGKQIE